MKQVYNAYGQMTYIDEVDMKIISIIIKHSAYAIDFVLNNKDMKKGYFITKYYNNSSKHELNVLFKDIPNVKNKIQRLMIHGIIEKEYNYNNTAFKLKIYSKLYQKQEITNTEDKKLKKKKKKHILDNQEYVLKLIEKEYRRRKLPIERFHRIYDNLIKPIYVKEQKWN